ncbi:MAG: fasciclin domain-containing protein [Syntrophotaleaceae bacterium]
MADIMETIAANESLKTLAKVIEHAGFAERLKGAGPFTFFAPNEVAFGKRNLEEMLKDMDKLKTKLEYHLVSGKHAEATLDAVNTFTLTSECGKTLSVYLDENEVMIDNAHIVEGDIECDNGVLHIIDNVFVPAHSGWYETTS